MSKMDSACFKTPQKSYVQSLGGYCSNALAVSLAMHIFNPNHVSLALQQCSSGYSSRLSSGRTRVRISLTSINGGVAKVTTVAKAKKRCATTNILCGGSVFMESVLIKNTCFSILPELWCRLAAFGLFGPGFDYISFIFGYV